MCFCLKLLKKLCSHQILTNKTLFNLEFFKFLKQAQRRKIKEKPPPFFLGVFFLLIPFKRKEEDIKIA
ncbi:hypothetical protein ECC27_05425 [Helicobacter pylori]|nr:hypothetical protein ECC27_05425 [Helicobacter pylori]